MPHSLKVRLKNLQRKGELTEKDINRIFKALSQEPCDDAISRADLLKVVMGENFKSDFPRMSKALVEIIKALPSVTQKSGNPQPSEHFIDGVRAMGYREGYKDAQKQKSGKWTLMYEPKNMAVCSECGKCAYIYQDKTSAFCPNCGAKMVEPQEGSDKE